MNDCLPAKFVETDQTWCPTPGTLEKHQVCENRWNGKNTALISMIIKRNLVEKLPIHEKHRKVNIEKQGVAHSGNLAQNGAVEQDVRLSLLRGKVQYWGDVGLSFLRRTCNIWGDVGLSLLRGRCDIGFWTFPLRDRRAILG